MKKWLNCGAMFGLTAMAVNIGILESNVVVSKFWFFISGMAAVFTYLHFLEAWFERETPK